jgi:hypothetical protein
VRPQITRTRGNMADRSRPFGGEILPERPTQRDVHELDSAADREHRKLAATRFVEERDLEEVPRAIDALEARRGRLVVEIRIDVLASGEEQPVHSVEERSGQRAAGTPPAATTARR